MERQSRRSLLRRIGDLFAGQGAPSAPATPPGVTDPGHGDAVVAAETRYAGSLRRAVGLAALVAVLLVGIQILLAWLTATSGAASGQGSPMISPATLSVEQGGTALVLLLPASIALQVLLRMPRDPESTGFEDSVAHRQFWGRVAVVVAMASAFVALSSFLGAMAVNFGAGTLDVVQIFGIPVGAALTLLIAADAAVLADLEAERLSLASSRAEDAVVKIEDAITRIPGKADPHPKRSLVVQSLVVGILVIGAATAGVFLLVRNPGLTAAFAFFATALSLFALGTATQIVPSLLQAKILDALLVLVPPALVTLVVVLEGATSAMPLIAGTDEQRYLQGLAYGLLITVPPALIVTFLLVPRGPARVSPPLFAVARAALEAQIGRLRNQPARTAAAPWRVLSTLAIITCLVPPVSVVLVIAATWLRKQSGDRRVALLVVAWVFTMVVAGLEIAALATLPLWWSAL